MSFFAEVVIGPLSSRRVQLVKPRPYCDEEDAGRALREHNRVHHMFTVLPLVRRKRTMDPDERVCNVATIRAKTTGFW